MGPLIEGGGGSPMSPVDLKKIAMRPVVIFVMSMSIFKYVNFKIWHLSNLRNTLCCVGFMSSIDLKKWPCYPVEFKGQGS